MHFRLTDCNSDQVQVIRLFIDVLLLGPLLIWLGLNRSARLPPLFSILLVLIGISTIVFNGVNYLVIEQRRAPGSSAEGGIK